MMAQGMSGTAEDHAHTAIRRPLSRPVGYEDFALQQRASDDR
jgi:hypothetical protein